MPVIVVANPKGGVGKSTLSTNIAGFYASRGYGVALGDTDPQASAELWLGLRAPTLRPISTWPGASAEVPGKPPRGLTHAVLDTHAGLASAQLKQVLKLADKVIVPLQPSVFDIFATRAFLDELAAHRSASSVQVGIVGMRVDERTKAAEQWHHFVDGLGFTVLGALRDTQNYIHLAAQGLTLFDVAPARVARDLEQWQGICRWLEA